MDKYPEEESRIPRKRAVNLSKWAREKAKLQRYSSPGLPPQTVGCNHSKKKKVFYCEPLSHRNIAKFHRMFYENQSKIAQDNFLLKYTDAEPTKRTRFVTHSREKTPYFFKYFMLIDGIKRRVCQKAFLKTLLLSKNRVQGVIHRHIESGTSAKERRGGDTSKRLYADKQKSVIQFIKQFKCIESHYCRGKSTRAYMQSDLNINKMWCMYDEKHRNDDLNVKSSFFRKVFRTKFNIGFGSPKTDECSTCLSLTERIKHSNNDVLRTRLLTEKKVHELKARAFYNLLKKKDDKIFVISFDCQKNQTLPHVQDQSAYYSRQLYKYNLTIVVGNSKAPQTSGNVFIYHWCENEQKKGSNEVSSAVYSFLLNFAKIPTEVEKVRIFCDGCGGQNKNSNVIGMLGFWLLKVAPTHIKEIELIFPMVGHSFLPSDRVFGRIEKDIKKQNTIVQPDEYTEIFKKQGTTIPLAGKVYDFKTAVTLAVRPPAQWHFKFNAAKRFLFRVNRRADNVEVKGEQLYNSSTGAFMSISKKGKTFSNIAVNPVSVGVPVSPAKLTDVENLLVKHYGPDWKELEILKYYKDVLHHEDNNIEQEVDPDTCCENATSNENSYT